MLEMTSHVTCFNQSIMDLNYADDVDMLSYFASYAKILVYMSKGFSYIIQTLSLIMMLVA